MSDLPPPHRKTLTQNPIYQMVLTRLIEFIRKPQAVFWVYFFPLMMAFSLGIAFREKPVQEMETKVALASGGSDRLSAPITSIPAWIESLKGFQIVKEMPESGKGSLESALDLLRRGRVDAVIEWTEASGPAGIRVHTDPTRIESTLAKARLEAAYAKSQHPELKPFPEVPLSLGGLRYIDFLIPGLLGINLMGGGLWGVGYALVDLRVRKLLKRFAATPMKVSDLLTSLAISRFIFTMGQLLVLVGVSWLTFGVTIRGNFFEFLFLVCLGGFCFLTIGLFVACRVTTYEAVNGIMNLVMLPMYVFSGVFFSAERFPEFMAPAIKILPLTALNDALRAIMNEGRSLSSLGLELGILTFWTVLCLFLAIRFFKWR